MKKMKKDEIFLTISISSLRSRSKNETGEPAYLGSEVLLGGEGFSESTEAMLDQLIQIT